MNSKPSQTNKSAANFEASKQKNMFYQVSGAGALWIAGPDQEDFLQRQTTNDLALISSSQPLVTVLTSPTARILDVLTLVQTTNEGSGDPELLALTLPDRAETTAAYLKSKIFFMDNVTVADVSADYHQIEVFGSGLQTLFESLGFREAAEPPSVDSTTLEAALLTLLRQKGIPPRLVMRGSMDGPLTTQLEAHGALPLSHEEYQILRVEAGRPGQLGELNADYTPLENNMNWAISSTKGCYTGQEVIARQITYDKVTRKLVGVQLGAEVAVGSKVFAGKQAAGTVTSTALSSKFGPIALAMIKRPHNETGADVTIGDQDSGVLGTVADLPFS